MKKMTNRVALHVLEIPISYEILIMAYNFRKSKEKKKESKMPWKRETSSNKD